MNSPDEDENSNVQRFWRYVRLRHDIDRAAQTADALWRLEVTLERLVPPPRRPDRP